MPQCFLYPACRWREPCATATSTRTRRSSDRVLGMTAGLHPANSLSHLNHDSGIPWIQPDRPSPLAAAVWSRRLDWETRQRRSVRFGACCRSPTL